MASRIPYRAGVTALQPGDRVGPAAPVVVEAWRVSAFAAALGVPVRPAAPVTLVVALALSAPGGPVGLLEPLVAAGDAAAVVHGDQQLTVHRAIRVGDHLVFSSTVRTVRRLPGATMAVILTEVAEVSGEALADLQATFVLADPVAAFLSADPVPTQGRPA